MPVFVLLPLGLIGEWRPLLVAGASSGPRGSARHTGYPIGTRVDSEQMASWHVDVSHPAD